MNTRSQKSNAVEYLVSAEFETSRIENNVAYNLVTSTSKSPKPEKIDKIKAFLRQEIKSNLTMILAEIYRSNYEKSLISKTYRIPTLETKIYLQPLLLHRQNLNRVFKTTLR